jgi:hypothetical protein
MRAHIKSIIKPEEAEHLLGTAIRDWSIPLAKSMPPTIKRVLDRLRDHVDFELNEQSYWRVQDTPEEGVWWHCDSGSHGHMSWCTVGVSILLTDDRGAQFKYRRDGREDIVTDRERYDALLHSSDWEHSVGTPEPGAPRTVLLFFI